MGRSESAKTSNGPGTWTARLLLALLYLFAQLGCAGANETEKVPTPNDVPAAKLPPSAQLPQVTAPASGGQPAAPAPVAGSPGDAPSSDGPRLSARASRVACVAPCPVLFDATDTTDPGTARPFQALRYLWDFDDDPNEVWSISGRSKNHAIGALAGHVYTRPGSYRPSLVVSNRKGLSTSLRLQIEVSDPEQVFGGAGTTCVSSQGNFSGCPAGAKHVTSSNASGALHNRDGRRTLLRRGELFGGGAIRLADASRGEAILGAFGEGPKPLLAGVSITGNRGWRVMDLQLRGPGPKRLDRAFVGRPSDFTIFRVDVDRWNACIAWNGQQERITGNAVVDFTCDDFAPSGGAASKIFENSSETLWMGLHIDQSNVVDGKDEFNLRAVYTFKEVIQHSRFEGSPPYRNAIQLRGCKAGRSPWCQTLRRPSKYLIFSDNHIIEERRTGSIIKTTHFEGGSRGLDGNQNEDFIFERNLIQVDNFKPMSPLQRIFELQATQATIRNNVFDLQEMPLGGKNDVLVTLRPSEVPGIHQGSIHVLNNTIYLGRDFGAAFTICNSADLGRDHVCVNNLVYAPGMQRKLRASRGEGWVTANNVLDTDASSSPFAGDPPGHLQSNLRDLSGFRLAPGARSAGGAYDFGSDPKGTDDDIGADIFWDCPAPGAPLSAGADQPGAPPCVAPSTATPN